MRVLLTGHLGYIGSHLTDILVENGHFVRGIDLNYFEDSRFAPLRPASESIVGDFTTLTERDLEGFDAVMHLGAICNDPMGSFAPELTLRTNQRGTIELARRAQAAGVPRFLISSSCSIYGKTGNRILDETDAVEPLTVYAQSKIESERRVAELADRTFSPVYLRNATAYGSSPRLRLDLVVNDLTSRAFATGELRIHSDGSPWRPFVHCRDIARAFLHIAEAPRETVHNQAFNVGLDAENHQVRDIVDLVLQAVPGSGVVYTGEDAADARDYKVSFAKFAAAFPDFRFEYTVESGIEELLRDFRRYGMTADMIQGPRFSRLRTLELKLNALAGAGR
jgi:nucleoside-diphosphate-sugar epimerase